MTDMIEIGRLRQEDRAAWEVLARGYKAFYHDPETDEAYEATWLQLASGTDPSDTTISDTSGRSSAMPEAANPVAVGGWACTTA